MNAFSLKDKKSYVTVAITFAIMLGFGFLPPVALITPDGMRVLGIFLGCLYAWIAGEIVWSSILGIVILCAFGYGTMIENFASAYGNNTVSILLTSVIFCYAIEKSGLLSELSRWIVAQRWAQKSIWLLILAFYIASLVITVLANNGVTTMVLLWALYYELSKEIGAKPFDTLTHVIICGVAVAAAMGCCIMPYAGMTTIVRGLSQQIAPDLVFNTAEYILLNTFLAILFLPIMLIFMWVAFNSKIKNVKIPNRDPYKMNLNFESKASVIVLGIIIFAMIIPNFLPEDNIIRSICNQQLTPAGLFMLGSVILMVIRSNGKPVLDIAESISHAPWPLILLLGAALCISNYLTLEEMGIIPTISSFLGPIVEGKSPFAITMIFMALGLIMTNFINDVATIMVLFPIAAQFILELDGSIMLLTLLFAQAAVQGCLMPSGSMIGAMMHGNSYWLKGKNIIIVVGIMEIAVLVDLLIVTLVGYFIGL